MNRKTILIVPPQGAPLKALRIRLWAALLISGIIIVGLTGWFLPFTFFTNDISEQNQRKNLVEQNRALLQKIISTLRMLKELKARIVGLERQRVQVSDISGKRYETTVKTEENIDFSHLKSEDILSQIEKVEKCFAPFETACDSINPFDSLPVLPPLPPPIVISRQFGPTLDPFSGKNRAHNGIDFIGEAGTPVLATASGIVTRVEKHEIWGNRVFMQHGSGFNTVYAHLGTVKTSQGRRVKRGEKIGEIGLSGLTSGPHVHYEIWNRGRVLDPEKLLFPCHLFTEK